MTEIAVTETAKSTGTNFEKRVVELLQKLEFSDVDGARDNFRLGGIQVDAVAGWENVLLVFECTSKRNLGKKDLSEKIHSFQGKIDLIRNGVSEDPMYGRYKKIWFILATRNIEVRDVDIALAIKDKDKRVYIWFDDFLEYYASLYSFIKPYAKYDLLGELGIRPLTTAPITVPAFRTNIRGTVVYTFLMNPRDLLEVAFVARRERGTEQYYQRLINEGRLGRIASYIKSGGIFPNNIILAFREDIPISFKEQPFGSGGAEKDLQFGILSFPRDYRGCWIIDGQHRLYAFASVPASAGFRMPITAFEKLPVEYQRKYFLDINRNQKSVDPDLLWDLSGDFPESIEGVISNAVKYLNTHAKSPIRGLVYYPSARKLSKKGKLKIAALCIAIKKNRLAHELTLQNIGNQLFSRNPEKHYADIAWALIRYLTVAKDIFPKNWAAGNKGFILSTGGMTVMIGLFERILSRVAESGNTPTPADYGRYLAPIIPFLEERNAKAQHNLRLRATSEAGKSELVNEFVMAIRKETRDGRFGGNVESKGPGTEFIDLENLLKQLILKYYSDPSNPNWLSTFVDEYTFKKALKNTEKNIGRIDLGRAYFGLTLGECFTLINNNFERVQDVFINEEEHSFSNKSDFRAAGEWIGHIRAKTMAHATGARVKKSDMEVYESFMSKILACLQADLLESEIEDLEEEPKNESEV